MQFPGQVPLIGQRDQQQAAMEHVIISCYLSLVPVVATHELAHRESYDGGDEDIPDIVAKKAWDIAQKALARIGIQVKSSPK